MKLAAKPKGVGKPLYIQSEPCPIFTKPDKAFKSLTEADAQREFIEAYKHDVRFVDHGAFWHYIMTPTQILPRIVAELGEAGGYIWTIGPNLNAVTPIEDYAVWADACQFIDAAYQTKGVQ